jgi:DNA-binding HxlR family transcriptional regulator
MGRVKTDRGESGCPGAFAMSIFGDRWSLLIIRDMMLLAKRHYGEFLESPEGIASNILAERLKRFEEAGIVSKTLDPDNQRKNIYELTEKGYDLIPVVLEALLWGAKHSPQHQAPKRFIKRIANERDAVIAEIIAHVRAQKPYLPTYMSDISGSSA